MAASPGSAAQQINTGETQILAVVGQTLVCMGTQWGEFRGVPDRICVTATA